MTLTPLPRVARTNATNWRALLMGLFLAFNAVSLCGTAILTVILAIVAKKSAEPSELLTLFMLAASLFFSAILLVPGIVLNARIFFNLPGFHIHFPLVQAGIIFIILAACWVPVLLLGGAIAVNPLAAILLPSLNILAIGLPVLFLLRLTLRNLELPSAEQAWSVFGVTLAIGPVIAVILEAIVLLIFGLVAGLYLASSHPQLVEQIAHLAETVQQTSNSDRLVALIAPLLFTPAGMLVLFGVFSVAIPIIEEATKVVALWLFADKIKHPVQGFALGIVCGAAFALAESLGYASTGASAWTATAIQRASAALPHMLNSGILGWALVSAWKERAYIKIGTAYLAVMLIHGLWNAISIVLLLNALISYAPKPVPPLIADTTPLLIGWGVLIIGAFGGLIYCNRALRRSQPMQAGYSEPPSYLNSGDNHGLSKNTD